MREAIKDKLKSIHIIEACDRIDSYYPNKEIPILDAKSIEFFGLAKNLEIIGEAAYMLTIFRVVLSRTRAILDANIYCRQ